MRWISILMFQQCAYWSINQFDWTWRWLVSFSNYISLNSNNYHCHSLVETAQRETIFLFIITRVLFFVLGRSQTKWKKKSFRSYFDTSSLARLISMANYELNCDSSTGWTATCFIIDIFICLRQSHRTQIRNERKKKSEKSVQRQKFNLFYIVTSFFFHGKISVVFKSVSCPYCERQTYEHTLFKLFLLSFLRWLIIGFVTCKLFVHKYVEHTVAVITSKWQL